ncbi:MAG TPA: HDIG domain-containing protein [Chloroflexi bacterium]|nr:HDIG domain-containing protein [Chloroflexota bacterium]
MKLKENDSGKTGKASWPQIARALILGVAFTILTALSLTLEIGPGEQIALKEGDVSPYDIRAPREITYISEVLTEEARNRAEAAVEAIYDPPEIAVARRQLSKAQAILDFIDAVRQDPYASEEEKASWLEAIAEVSLPRKVITTFLTLEESRWQRVAEEVKAVLDRAMRTEIRENQLAEVKRRIPAMVSWQLEEDEAAAVVALVGELIRPNAFYNAKKTEEARRAAREKVKPVNRTIEKGEIIVRAGDVVGPLEMEALEVLGLKKSKRDWRKLAGPILLALTLNVAMGLYCSLAFPKLLTSLRFLYLLFALSTVFLIAAKLMIPGHVVLPYLYPLAALTALLTTAIDISVAMVVTVLMSILAGYMAGNFLELTVYYTMGGVFAALVLKRGEKINSYFWAGLALACVNFGVILAFRLPQGNYDIPGIITLAGAALINGVISTILALGGSFLLGSLFGFVTPLHLIELSRPTHPLLQQLLLKAPGTYHHSILVSNMAEQAAERIGANALLARVGAYYHDIGKSLRPYFFVENQMDGVNVHQRLDPKTSAQIIISHVKDGLELARKYHLPPQIQDFITQHQGTELVRYFYEEASKEGKTQVEEEDFRYPGPRPQTKETAIVMLADAAEAAVRAAHPSTPEEIDEIVRKIIKEKLESGELDESNLTLKDLSEIRKTFVAILQGVFHPRVAYPEQKEKANATSKGGTPAKEALPEAGSTREASTSSRFRIRGRRKRKSRPDHPPDR